MPSPSESFSLNKNQLITLAFYVLNAYTPLSPIPPFYMDIGGMLLNSLIKYWQQVYKAQVLTRKTGYIFTQVGQNVYTLDYTGDNSCLSYIQTSVETAISSPGSNTIVLESVSGMLVGDFIGIQLATNSNLFWTTISSINSMTNTVTLNNNLPDKVNVEAIVYDYTTKLDRPVQIHGAWRSDTIQQLDVPMAKLSSTEYEDLPLKQLAGLPVSWWYEPQYPQGYMHLFMTPNDVSQIITISFTHEVDDYDLATDTSDFSSAWYLPIIYGLAALLAPMYGKYQEAQFLTPIAKQFFDQIRGSDTESGDIEIVRT